jgi:uncharacterized protein YebE (UPF0316 family)
MLTTMFAGWPPIAIYAFIFFAKLVEVVIFTMRTLAITRGNKKAAVMFGGIGITLWMIVVSSVLLNIWDDPLRAVFYVLAFALGIYLGILIEDKLALGLAQIEVIAECETAHEITEKFRKLSYRVTTFNCEGLDGKKISIVLKVLRKDVPVTMELLGDYPQLFVSITDIRKLPIGTIHRSMFVK